MRFPSSARRSRLVARPLVIAFPERNPPALPASLRRSTHDDAHVHLDERHSLPRKATTNYKAKKGNDFLTVEAIWFFAKFYAANPKAAHPAYMKEALAAKFAQISLLDRKDLLAYLTGEVDTSANIDVNVPALTDAPLVGEKRGRDEAGAAREPRRTRRRECAPRTRGTPRCSGQGLQRGAGFLRRERGREEGRRQGRGGAMAGIRRRTRRCPTSRR